MALPDRSPIYGPIESKFDQARDAATRSDIKDTRVALAYDHSLYLRAHFDTDITTTGRLLPVFATLRETAARQSPEKPVTVDEVRQALIDGGYLGKESFRWDTHMETIGRAYMIDREAIDRALDFEAVREKTQP